MATPKPAARGENARGTTNTNAGGNARGTAKSAVHENYARIYAVIKKIPKGKVATYGQIAALAGIPRGARQVGTALRNTPVNLTLPWQRVINAQGHISLRMKDWQSGGDDYQRVLLEGEGVAISAEGKIDLQRYRWAPASLYKQKTER